MKLIHKSAQPEIKIYDYDAPNEPIFVLSPKGGYTQLLDYSFSEKTGDLNGSFNFSIAGGDNNLFDKIKPLHIVKIFEGSNIPCFTGIIKARNLSCSMGDSGVRRSISFSGNSITSLIANFQLIMDLKFLHVLKVQDADSLNKELIINIAELQANENLTIKQFLDLTWKTYLNYTGVAGKVSPAESADKTKSAPSNILVYTIIKNFMTENFFEIGNAAPLPIPIANAFFNQDINTVLQIWQTILSPPVYEIFSRVNKEGKTRVVVRETPFDSKDWINLPIYEIKSYVLKDYSLRLSDEEVYTAFLGYIEGSELSPDQYVIIEEADANKRDGSIISKDNKKFNIYGLKLCQVGFRGYHKDKQEMQQTVNAMKNFSERLKKWFGKLDEMYTGSATIINTFDDDYKNRPHCGGRVKFLGGEFYIQGVEHRWSYGGAPVINLSLIRGGIYDGKGNFIMTIPDMGTSGIEFKDED